MDISNPSSAEILSDNHEALNLDNKYSASSEDEDLDPEDKDIHAQFYGALAKMVVEKYNPNPQPATITEVSSDEEEILKKYKATKVIVSNEKSDFAKTSPIRLSMKKNDTSSEQSVSR